jgi:hypothetical protein
MVHRGDTNVTILSRQPAEPLISEVSDDWTFCEARTGLFYDVIYPRQTWADSALSRRPGGVHRAERGDHRLARPRSDTRRRVMKF